MYCYKNGYVLLLQTICPVVGSAYVLLNFRDYHKQLSINRKWTSSTDVHHCICPVAKFGDICICTVAKIEVRLIVANLHMLCCNFATISAINRCDVV